MMDSGNEKLIIMDLGSFMIRKFLGERCHEAFKTRVNPHAFLRKAQRELGYDDQSIFTEEFLLNYLDYIEQKMKEIIVKYSCHELFYWTRRIAPRNVYKRDEMTVLLYRETLDVAIAKYGSLDENRFFFDEEKVNAFPLILKGLDENSELNLELKKIIAEAFYLESLAWLYVHITQRIRIWYKGGCFELHPVWGLNVKAANEEISYLIDLYDRRIKYDNLLSRAGTFLDRKQKLTKNALMIYQINVDHKHQVPVDPVNRKGNFLFPSNYLPIAIDFGQYMNYLLLFTDEIYRKFGFSAEVFIASMVSLSIQNAYLFFTDLQYRHAMYQRAYTLIEDEEQFLNDWIESGSEWYKHEFGAIPQNFEDQFRFVFDLITCSKEAPRDMELWTRGPRPLYFPLANKMGLFDYSGILSLLKTFMLPISKTDGETANKRSLHFEMQTGQFVRTQLPGVTPWIERRQISTKDGALSREIDASFVWNNILFILECKSVNVSFTFDMGLPRALEYRKGRNQAALSQADDKAIFLVTNKDHLTIPLPDGVSYIVPLVVSPFAEYIWSRDDALFLSKDVPRILTIEELKNVLDIPKDQLLEKPFVYSLN